MMDFKDKILGWSISAERYWGKSYEHFIKIINKYNFHIGVVIGVAYGGHSEAILKKTQIKKLYGVDPFSHSDNYEGAMNLPQIEFDQLYLFVLDRMKPYGHRYTLLREYSKEAAQSVPNEIDFVYIDADHSYNRVFQDLCKWFPKVKNGGIIGGHVYNHPNFPGITKAVDEFFRRFNWEIHYEGDNVWWVEKKPLNISFFIPAYNCSKTIEEAVESIINTNFEKEDELIIVDDFSKDGTYEKLKELQEKHPFIKIIQHTRNKGGGAARNTAIENSSNQILFCLDSDNILVPASINELKSKLIDSGSDAAAFQELHYFYDNINNITHKWIFSSGVIELQDSLSGNVIPGASGNYLFTKESWFRAKGYPEYAGALDTWGFGFQQLVSGSKIVILSDTFYYHRYGYESYYVEDSRRRNLSITALQIILPYIKIFHSKDIDFILSKKNRYNWFENLSEHPIRLKDGTRGKNGTIIYFDNTLSPKNAACCQKIKEFLALLRYRV